MSRKKIKCVVWDLDNTIWDGILLENQDVRIRSEVLKIINELDNRGILQSISSRNDATLALKKLTEFGIKEFFLYPEINWNPKSSSIEEIANSLNIGLDTIAFVDDQVFELEEVMHSHPEIHCINAKDIHEILDMSVMMPEFITEDSKNRRKMYITDITRKKIEENFKGPKEDFLASLNMKLTISLASKDDLNRAHELTLRTNQLNTTGYSYSYEELDNFRKSKDHILLIVQLDDRYGQYGKIGLSLIDCTEDVWTIKLLLMSCRVMSRGVGTVLIRHVTNMAIENSVELYADFLHSPYNRMMYVTYKLSGFKEIHSNGDSVTFKNVLKEIQKFPDYINVEINQNELRGELHESKLK